MPQHAPSLTTTLRNFTARPLVRNIFKVLTGNIGGNFLNMIALSWIGVALGLKPKVASALTMQTVLGAAHMAQASSEPLSELRRRVTSPGGTTAAALAKFDELGLAEVLKAGLAAARDRSIELAKASGH